ncbi:unnamed protein product [Colletotrichum noveboracense]|uniref:NAD(P)/FAD-dependent oxidoreductase n=1 Tax=Colletotrichum noveboracense TaxID=2664923 RepID=A0A9W4W8S7_9PEZI|nr:unnamed protein product [Colletotrichum noveboracense]
MGGERKIKSVAIIGAGAAGAVTAAAFKAEDYFEKIRVYERRESAGGTWYCSFIGAVICAKTD